MNVIKKKVLRPAFIFLVKKINADNNIKIFSGINNVINIRALLFIRLLNWID